jgi:hypothetical protein
MNNQAQGVGNGGEAVWRRALAAPRPLQVAHGRCPGWRTIERVPAGAGASLRAPSSELRSLLRLGRAIGPIDSTWCYMTAPTAHAHTILRQGALKKDTIESGVYLADSH